MSFSVIVDIFISFGKWEPHNLRDLRQYHSKNKHNKYNLSDKTINVLYENRFLVPGQFW